MNNRKLEVSIMVLVAILVAFPLLFLGPITFYSDDIHFLRTIHHEGGVFQGIYSWWKGYGLIYRPLGITLLYIIYFLSFSSSYVLYSFSMLSYLFMLWSVYRTLSYFKVSSFVSLFSLILIAFFPFNATAFYQNSSLYMTLVTGTIIGLIPFCVRYWTSVKGVLSISILWCVLILTYEQVVGIAALFVLYGLQRYIGSRKRKFLVLPSIISFITLIFLFLYFSNSKNPKVVSLVKINREVEAAGSFERGKYEISTQQNSHAKPQDNMQGVQKNSMSLKPEKRINRLESLKRKGKKGAEFLVKGISYGTQKLMSSPLKFIFFVAIYIFFIFCLMRSTQEEVEKRKELTLGFYSFIWCIVTIAPFLLYKNLSIPPYVLMTPFIGLAVSFMAFSLSILKFHREKLRGLFKLAAAIVAFCMLIQQYSYYFGLKEELLFWRNAASKVTPVVERKILSGDSVVIGYTEAKENEHIFWLEHSVGYRFFRVLLGDEFSTLEIKRNGAAHEIYLSLIQ